MTVDGCLPDPLKRLGINLPNDLLALLLISCGQQDLLEILRRSRIEFAGLLLLKNIHELQSREDRHHPDREPEQQLQLTNIDSRHRLLPGSFPHTPRSLT